MEGKSLCLAFCAGEAGEMAETSEPDPPTNIVALDFRGGGQSPLPQAPARQPPARPSPDDDDALFTSLGEFISDGRGEEWHDPARGLVIVRGILDELHAGVPVSLPPDFEFFNGDDYELTESVTYDLEALEEILTAAQKEGSRFRLIIEA